MGALHDRFAKASSIAKDHAMDVITLFAAAVLLSPEFKQALARRLVEDEMTRMGGFIFLMSRILDFTDGGGKILNEYGAPIYIHADIVEEAYAYELSFSWTTDIKVFAHRKPKRKSPGRHLLRLQLWQAAYLLDGRALVIE